MGFFEMLHSSLRPVAFSSDRVQERAQAPWSRAGGDGEEQTGFCSGYKRGSGRRRSGPGEVVSSGLLGGVEISGAEEKRQLCASDGHYKC